MARPQRETVYAPKPETPIINPAMAMPERTVEILDTPKAFNALISRTTPPAKMPSKMKPTYVISTNEPPVIIAEPRSKYTMADAVARPRCERR
jgi:hypothetical protein